MTLKPSYRLSATLDTVIKPIFILKICNMLILLPKERESRTIILKELFSKGSFVQSLLCRILTTVSRHHWGTSDYIKVKESTYVQSNRVRLQVTLIE